MASIVYNWGKTKILDGTVDLLTSTVKAMLVDDNYVPNVDHRFVDDGSSGAANPLDNELTDASYARKTPASKSVAVDDTNDLGKFTSDPITWAALAGSDLVGGLILYVEVGGDTTSILLCFLDSASLPITPNGTDFVATPHANGWFNF
jgi:hypothetical protein